MPTGTSLMPQLWVTVLEMEMDTADLYLTHLWVAAVFGLHSCVTLDSDVLAPSVSCLLEG